MKILAVETSCDETAIAFLEASGGLKNPRFKILKNLVASQIKIHRPFGGVVPSLAKREHIKNLPILLKKLVASGYTLNPNLMAVTVGPGLEPALWTGIGFAKDLYEELRIKNKELRIVGVSHLEGHLYSLLLNSKSYIPRPTSPKDGVFGGRVNSKKLFPAIALIISGGHTILIKMDSLIKYKKIGETRDDAVGEAFDKVARLLGMSYPGGPEIEKLAKKGDAEAINFPRPMLSQKNYDFSFSGLKTAVLYYLRDSKTRFKTTNASESTNASQNYKDIRTHKKTLVDLNKFVDLNRLADVAASFQQAAFDVLISKTLMAAEEFNAKSIMVVGGVAANKTLKKEFQATLKAMRQKRQGKEKNRVSCPVLLVAKFPGDNAAMIAAAGYLDFLQGKSRRLIAKGEMSL